jgi:glycine oxidase
MTNSNSQKNIDFLIVGCGLAGIAFAETCLNNNKSVFVFDNNSQKSSTIAGGLYNPVILKRFSGLEFAQEQLDLMNIFYAKIEQKLHIKIDYKNPVFRKFHNVEEVNNWFVASDKPSLKSFLSLKIREVNFKGIDFDFGLGQVLQSGFLDTSLLLKHYRDYLCFLESYAAEKFDFKNLSFKDDLINYNNICAKHIVFAEGFGLNANPFFNYLPLDGTKGELLIVKAPNLDLNLIINSSVFIIPLGNHLFKIGATYNWTDKTDIPTNEGKMELVDKIKELINCDFEVIEHLAGVRPTVKDRKPLLGTHKNFKNLHILNGLGTRGVMLGPWCADKLFQHIEFWTPLDRSISISRFEKLLI